MTKIGMIHFTLSLCALASGGGVLLRDKGTRLHRWLGYTYAVSIVGVVTTSFMLFNLTGGMNVLHWAAIVSAFTLSAGLLSMWFRRPRASWLQHHATWMAWSYLGLVGAFVAEMLTRVAMPLLLDTLEQQQLVGAFWMLVAVATAATVGVGSRIIKRLVPQAIARVANPSSRKKRIAATLLQRRG